MHDVQTQLTQPPGVEAANSSPAERRGELVLQMAEERVAKLAAARLQMEQEAADAIARQSRAQVHSVAQPEGSESQTAAAEASQARSEGEAGERQGQLLSDIRDVVKMARDGIKQRQVALQYARTTWQVHALATYLPGSFPT